MVDPIVQALTLTDVVVDAQGWVQASTSVAAYGQYLNPMAPYRVLDTRVGTGGANRPLGPGATITVPVDGGFSSGVTLNLTVTNASTASYLVVWPAGQRRPPSSNINCVISVSALAAGCAGAA